MTGEEITRYKEKVVPQFLHELKELFPEKYAAFENEFPDYEIKPPDWRGRIAKLSTCSKEQEYKDKIGNTFKFDGNDIVCDCYKSSFTPFGGRNAKIRIRATDEMQVEITDNAQVTVDTVFV